MGVLVTWAATQGLNLGASLIGGLLGKASPDSMILEKLDLIDHKLDMLLAAPYRQAQMHFREGNLEKTKDKLIEAISLDEFDLPALAMYALLLCRTGNTDLAVDYFERLLRQFGPHVGIVPSEIVTAYRRYLYEREPLRAIQQFHIERPDRAWTSYPTEIRCFLSGFVVSWEAKPGTRGGGALSS